jgi:hypothetical protein
MKKVFLIAMILLETTFSFAGQNSDGPQTCPAGLTTLKAMRIKYTENRLAIAISSDDKKIEKLKAAQAQLEYGEAREQCLRDEPKSECLGCQLLTDARDNVARLKIDLLQVDLQRKKAQASYERSLKHSKNLEKLKKEFDEVGHLIDQQSDLSQRLTDARKHLTELTITQVLQPADHALTDRIEIPMAADNGETKSSTLTSGEAFSVMNLVNSAIQNPL